MEPADGLLTKGALTGYRPAMNKPSRGLRPAGAKAQEEKHASKRPLLLLAANTSWTLCNFGSKLIEALLGAGYDIAALVPADDGIEELAKLGVAVHTVPLSPHGLSPIADLRLIASYVLLLRRLRPVALIGFTVKPNVYGSIAARICGVPVINHVIGLGTAFLSSTILEAIVTLLYRIGLRRSYRVFFLNREDRDLFLARRIVTERNSAIIPGSGIDLDRFAPAPAKCDDELVFLFVGRVLIDKGVVEFIKAAEALKPRIAGARFRILGPTGGHPKAVPDTVLAAAAASGAVELLGSTDDVRPYIAAADCIVLPSYREGLPRVLLEASAMARPMIASDVPGCRDVVDDEVTGYLCEARSPLSLEEAMLAFARNSPGERREMGKAARRKVERQFPDRVFIRTYLTVLGSLVAQRQLIAVSANTSWALINYRLRLLKTLREKGFRVVALVPNDKNVPKLIEAGMEVCPIEMEPHGTSPLSELFLLWRYVRRLRKLRPAAYLGFTIKPNVYGGIAGVLTGVPVINNVTGLGIVFARKGLLRVAVGQLCKFAYRRSHRVFFQNRESLALLHSLGFVREDQAALLPGSGIDLKRFAPTPTVKADGEDFTFLLAGRLIWEKGLAEYCEAARWFRERHQKVRFQLLGFVEPASNKSAVSKAQIDEWAAEGIVQYLGSTDDIRPFFSAADCIVLPSFYPEGVPRALIEAAAMGKPVITTDMPGCRDAVDDGETGFLCQPRSAKSLIEAMAKMMELPSAKREEFGRLARQKAERQFDERIVIEAYLGEIAAVIDEESGSRRRSPTKPEQAASQ